MKGIIFNLLEELVDETQGDDAWESLLALSNATGIYTSLGSYPDAELIALVDAAATVNSQSPDAILRWFGRAALPKLAGHYPEFFTAAPTARDFILAINTIIHPEVRKLYAGAACPQFHFATENDMLVVGYNSPRRMCALAHGFIEGVGDHYQQAVDVTHRGCMKSGDPSCRLALSFAT